MPLSIYQTPYYEIERNQAYGKGLLDRIYLLKVTGRAAGVSPQLRIGDDFIDLVWRDSHERINPVFGTSYIELFTVTQFYGQIDVIFYSLPPHGRMKPDFGSHDSYDDFTEEEIEPIGEEHVIENRIPYQQIRNRIIQVTLAGVSHAEGLESVFSSTVEEVITQAQAYDGLPFETQSYMVE